MSALRRRPRPPEAVHALQLLLQHLLRGGDELQRPHELGGGQQQLHGGLGLVHGGHQLQLAVQLGAVVARQAQAQRPQRALAHDALHGGRALPQHRHRPRRLPQSVLQLVLRGHGVEEGLGAQGDLLRDAHLHHVQVVTQLWGGAGGARSLKAQTHK